MDKVYDRDDEPASHDSKGNLVFNEDLWHKLHREIVEKQNKYYKK